MASRVISMPLTTPERDGRFLDQYWFNAPLIRTAENQVKGGGRTYFLTKYYVS